MPVHSRDAVDVAKTLYSMSRGPTPSERSNARPVMSAPNSRHQSKSPPGKPLSRAYRPSVSCVARKYDVAASIALVGIRGTGLSTLAVMAASALGFRLLDADQQFYQTTGLSRVQYRTVHGTSKYRKAELDLLRFMLSNHPTGAVIVCGPGAVESTGQSLLSDYASSHPVVYVTRDAQDIQTHLRLLDIDNISALRDLSAPSLRIVSNFEFHNVSHLYGSPCDYGNLPGDHSPTPLALKQVERDFLHLVFSITNTEGEHRYFDQRHSSLPIESRPYTYALVLHCPVTDDFWASDPQINELTDAVEVVMPCSYLLAISPIFDNATANYITRHLYTIRRRVQVPLILHIQLDEVESGRSAASMEYYFNALHHSLRLAPEYLCVDLESDSNSLRRLVSAKGSTKIIAQYHDASPPKSAWITNERRWKVSLAKQLGADVVRLTQKAVSLADNFAVRWFLEEVTASDGDGIPIIAYNTGDLGKMSRYLNNILSPVTDPLLPVRSPQDVHTGLLTIGQAQSALFSSFLLDPLYFGIYGNNVAQSLSPVMHNAAFRIYDIPHDYQVFQYSDIYELKRLIKDPKIGGLSVTAPFKSEVIPFVDYMSAEAQIIGAVNTLVPLRTADKSSLLVRNRAGPVLSIYGDNTDWVGIRECVRKNLSPINTIRPRTTALIIGAGGMARAAVYALKRLGVRHIVLSNRTRERAEKLIDHYRQQWSQRSDSEQSNLSDSEASCDISTADSPSMRILEQKDAWPEDINQPTIVVSCVATKSINGTCSFDNSLPENWLGSPTGGVVVEVSQFIHPNTYIS